MRMPRVHRQRPLPFGLLTTADLWCLIYHGAGLMTGFVVRGCVFKFLPSRRLRRRYEIYRKTSQRFIIRRITSRIPRGNPDDMSLVPRTKDPKCLAARRPWKYTSIWTTGPTMVFSIPLYRPGARGRGFLMPCDANQPHPSARALFWTKLTELFQGMGSLQLKHPCRVWTQASKPQWPLSCFLSAKGSRRWIWPLVPGLLLS